MTEIGSPSDVTYLEKGFLGAIMANPAALEEWQGQLTEADFYSTNHQEIWSAMVKVGGPLDYVLLSDYITANGLLDAVGGLVYIADVAKDFAPSRSLPEYAKRILEESERRSLHSLGAELVVQAKDLSKSSAELNEFFTEKIQELARKRQSEGLETMPSLTPEFRRAMNEAQASKRRFSGLDTGFNDLNAVLNGLCGSELLVIGARPSIGKTTLGLQLARNCVVYEKQPVAFFALEMSAQQVLQRLVCMSAGVNVTRLRRGILSPPEQENVVTALDEIEKWPLYIDATSGLTIPQMRARMLRMERAHGIKLWIVDYLQLMSGRGASENEQVNDISRGLKAFTKMFDQPLVVLSQLNRKVEERKNKRPMLADCRGSGGIEQDADSVILLHRPGFYTHLQENWNQKNDNDINTYAELIVEKCRFGPTNNVELRWVPERAEFANM